MSTVQPLQNHKQYTNARIKTYPSKAVMQVSNYSLFPVPQEVQPTPPQPPPLEEPEPPDNTETAEPPDRKDKPPTKNPDRAKAESKRRACSSVYDIAMLNPFTHFFTWTLDGTLIDRYSPEVVSRKTQTFLSNASQRKGFQYVLIPEFHKKKRGEATPALHLHGLCTLGDVKIERALTKNGRRRTDKAGRPIFNMLDWKWGFSTCVPLDGEYERAIHYVTKYITKAKDKIFGKWYFSSRTLKKKPDIITLEPIPFDEFRDQNKLNSFQQHETEIFSGVKLISEELPPLNPIPSETKRR